MKGITLKISNLQNMNFDIIEKIVKYAVIVAFIIGIMWLFEIGPFRGNTSSYQPTFTGTHSSYWTADAYYSDGSFFGKIKVYPNYITTPYGNNCDYYSTTGTGNTHYAYFAWIGSCYIYF